MLNTSVMLVQVGFFEAFALFKRPARTVVGTESSVATSQLEWSKS